ncbi:Fic/DOC family protein [Pseudonocardia acaciae]|uniref:Fic/DOC family protein n=1 Tax=Pseudonocardia acaciae TaxID=551276 RepID=UPI000687939E|nr:Fic family protein [Pseudonocardia acaciae]
MTGPDPYLDPTTGVLRNRLGITDPAELARAEAELTALRLVELRRTPLPGHYDLAHLRGFHRFIFGDVYDWAGEPRTVSIGKGHLFCLPQHIDSFAADIFGRLAGWSYLRELDRDEFLDRLAELLADINALHQFREGNGRTQRAFLTQLADDAGYQLRWTAMDPATNVEASKTRAPGRQQTVARHARRPRDRAPASTPAARPH